MSKVTDAWMSGDSAGAVRSRNDRLLLSASMAIGGVILLLLVWLGLKSLFGSREEPGGSAAAQGMPAAPYEDAGTLAKQLLAAPSIDALLPMVRNGSKVRGLMETSRLPLGGKVGNVSPIFSIGGHDLQRVSLQTESGNNLRLFVERRGSQLYADWPSLVGQSELTMAQLLQQKPATPVLMRVLAAAAEHAVGPFEDSKKWFCVRLFAPGQDETCNGYLDLKNPVLANLTKSIPLLSPDSTPEERVRNEGIAVPLAVRVAFPKEAATADQVEITEVLGTGWFIP